MSFLRASLVRGFAVSIVERSVHSIILLFISKIADISTDKAFIFISIGSVATVQQSCSVALADWKE